MKKPTPWPWNVVEAIEIIGADGIHVATVRPTIHWNELANVSLIAAAPELLEAVKDMLSGWKYIRSVHGDLPGVGWDRAQSAAEAAIAKAEGQ